MRRTMLGFVAGAVTAGALVLGYLSASAHNCYRYDLNCDGVANSTDLFIWSQIDDEIVANFGPVGTPTP